MTASHDDLELDPSIARAIKRARLMRRIETGEGIDRGPEILEETRPTL